jgi:hypothetical protein
MEFSNKKEHMKGGNMDMPKVAIIILNWNGWEYTLECLESLYQITYPNYDVVIVDNGSEDESKKKIKEYCEGKRKIKSKFFKYDSNNKPITIIEYSKKETESISEYKENIIEKLPSNKKLILIKNEKNYGFAQGNNIAIHYALMNPEVRYIATLNNDMVIDKLWLQRLVEIAEKYANIGSFASKMLFYDNPDIINAAGDIILKDGSGLNRGLNEKDTSHYKKSEEVFGACAGAALYKRELLNEVKFGTLEYFDKEFFAYIEDLDLAYRARLVGWGCLYVPSAIVYHHHSATAGKFSKFKVYQCERNRIWNLIKNYPIKYIILTPIYYTPLKLFLLFFAALNNKGHGVHYVERIGIHKLIIIMSEAWLDSIKKIPNMIKKRRHIRKLKKINNRTIEKWFNDFYVHR